VVGDYDFIANPSSEQLTDPIALQENFFVALDRVKDPNWVQGLASSGKKLNYPALTEKVFEKLNIGMELNDVLEDNQPAPMGPDELNNQPNPMEQAIGGIMPPGENQPMGELMNVMEGGGLDGGQPVPNAEGSVGGVTQ
jgi:hypothetical protein